MKLKLDAIRACPHRRHLVPPWKSDGRMDRLTHLYKGIGHIAMRENYGVTMDAARACFRSEQLKAQVLEGREMRLIHPPRVVFIGVAVNDQEDAWAAYTEKNKMDWPQFFDRSRKIATPFAVVSYPTYVVIDGDDLHLPIGKPVKVLLRSIDVLHDFYVPEFRSKMDMIPGLVTYYWFTPTRTGTFDVLCAELCGVGHPAMRGKVIVEEEGKYQAWLEKQQTFAELTGSSKPVKASYNLETKK